MEDFFAEEQGEAIAVPVEAQYPTNTQEMEFGEPNQEILNELPIQSGVNYQQLEQQPQPTPAANNDDGFDDFEEDEVTRKIRQEEERVQAILREKSQKEWEEKQERRSQGQKQLQQFRQQKQREKHQRIQENLQKEQQEKQARAKLNEEAGWAKVASNINLRQGEHKGTREINRMREAIIHKRDD